MERPGQPVLVWGQRQLAQQKGGANRSQVQQGSQVEQFLPALGHLLDVYRSTAAVLFHLPLA